MAAMVVMTALIGAVCIILLKLIAAFLREYKLTTSVNREIARLKDQMSCVKALLVSMDGMEELDVQRKIKLRELSFAMEECIGLFKYHLAEGDGNHQLKSLIARHRIAKKIQTLKGRAADEIHGHERYGLNEHITIMPNEQPPVVAIDPRLSSLYEGPHLVGIDRYKQEIISLLILMGQGPGASPRIKALSIEGCGGIGKSTLAKRVYHDIIGQFDSSVFVSTASASSRRSIKWILQEMLSELGFPGDATLDTKDQLIDKLREYLKDKRYLIVIDGIWSEEAWNIIRYAFIENNRSSVVIMTTRHHNIASACQQAPFHGCVYKVEPLNHADSTSLFCRRIFNSDDDCPEHLRSTLEQIVNKCGGVPLIILSLAGTLASQNVMLIENWEKICGLDTNPVVETTKHLLDLVYRDLCPNLRTCLLYLGMCSEYLVISKDDLVRRWIAEGFISKAYGCTQEEIAESYFNQLINRSIIQATGFDGLGQATSWQVHSVMHDFILSKALEENFFAVVVDIQHTLRGSAEVRRVYFHVDHAECERAISSMDLSRARSLDFWACSKCRPSLSRFHLLRVLHLDISFPSNGFLCDLTFLCKLYLLRYLKITSSHRSAFSGSVVRRGCTLPNQIRTLRYLKTLDVDAYLYSGLPQDICEVTSLSNIIVSNSLPPPRLPNGIGGLRDLRILKGFSILQCSVRHIQGLGDLSNLRELEVHVHLDAPDDAQDALVNSMRRLDRLHSLVIHCGDSFGYHLRYWSPPRGLQRFHVHGCFFDSVPDWMAQPHMDMVTSLVLGVRNLSSCGLGALARLPNLVHFRLSIVKFVSPVPVGAFWPTQHQSEMKILINRDMFPRLKSFWFRYVVPCDLMFEPGAMPSLESFGVRFIAERSVPSAPVLAGIQHLRSLTSFTAHIDSSSDENRALIHHRAVHHLWSLQELISENNLSYQERHWWFYVCSAELALRNAVSSHPTRPRVHIKYGDKPTPEV